MHFFLQICDGMSKPLDNTMTFAFTPIGARTGTDAFTAFTFLFTPMEAPVCFPFLAAFVCHIPLRLISVYILTPSVKPNITLLQFLDHAPYRLWLTNSSYAFIYVSMRRQAALTSPILILSEYTEYVNKVTGESFLHILIHIRKFVSPYITFGICISCMQTICITATI